MKYICAISPIVLLAGGFLAPGLLTASGPETLPLVRKADVEYLGAFRLPRGENGDPNGFSFGGSPLALDPLDGSLFVGTKDGLVGKVQMPAPAKQAEADSLPFATIIQAIRDPLEGGRSALPGSNLRGLLVSGGKLYGTAMIYYDADNSARVSHFSRSTDLAQPSATPLKALWQAEKSGFVAGWLAAVPPEWQSLLGGDVISGNCCVPIVSRTSFGPAAFAWRTADFEKSLVPATPLLYYPSDHPTLGPWEGANPVYGGTTMVGGMAIPSGTRSLLFFGANGTGTFCYGTGGDSGECYDPLSSDKGQHAYPYNRQAWAYDLNDLAAVKAGVKKPWEVEPYATWSLDDFPAVSVYGFGGVAYDSARSLLYLSELRADPDGYAARPLIRVYKIRVGGEEPPRAAASAPAAPRAAPGEAAVLPGAAFEEKPPTLKEGLIQALIRFLLKLKSRV